MEQDKGRMTRRSFLAGSALASAGMVIGSLAGCAPSDGKEQSTASADTTGSTALLDATSEEPKWAFEIAPDPIDDSLLSETIETDILVLGAGPSGFSTALSALDAGANNVVVIAKSSTWNALGGSMHAFNTKTMKEHGYEMTTDQISHELRTEWRNQADRSDNGKWTKAAYASEEALNWLIAYVEAEGYTTSLEIGPQDADGVHSTGPGSHSFMGDGAYGTQMISGGGIGIALAIMEAHIKEKGGQIFYNTTAQQLVRDDNGTGRVSAVIATDQDGNYIKYVAKQGIVLATGCITQNDDMLAKYAPETYACVKNGSVRLAGSTNTGDGTRMAMWIGAAPQRNWPWATEYNTPLLYAMTSDCTLFAGAKPYMMFPSMAVNQEGKRYMNEDCSMSMAAVPQIRQTGMLSYSIWTANLADALAPFEMFGRWYTDDNSCNWGSFDADTVKKCWDAGLGKGGGMTPLENAKFDTLDELASHFELPIDTLKTTIQNYNTYCGQGYDPEFAKRSALLVPIDMNGPFYCSKSIPTVFCTFGGPRCDVDAHVLDENDTVIEGLYVVGGIMMGDLYQPIYTYLFPGANMGFFNITYGYLTGRGIAEGTI